MTRLRPGLTLFETIVVVLLLGILWVAFLPRMTDARERATSAVCKSKLRELALLANAYAQRHGVFPWGMRNPMTHDAAYCRPHFDLLYPLEVASRYKVESWSEFESNCWDFRRKLGDRNWLCGDMFSGLNAAEALCCPKCRGENDNWDGNHMTGYNYNVCFLGYVENDKSKRNYPTRWEQVKLPERVVIFGDGGYSGGPNKFMRAPIQDKYYDNSASSLRKAGTQAFRHGRGISRHCNMAFADGHVEEFHKSYKAGGKEGWVDEKSYTGFISSGNGIYGPRGWGVQDTDEPR